MNAGRSHSCFFFFWRLNYNPWPGHLFLIQIACHSARPSRGTLRQQISDVISASLDSTRVDDTRVALLSLAHSTGSSSINKLKYEDLPRGLVFVRFFFCSCCWCCFFFWEDFRRTLHIGLRPICCGMCAFTRVLSSAPTASPPPPSCKHH